MHAVALDFMLSTNNDLMIFIMRYTHRWIVPPLHPLSHLSYRPSVVTLRNGYRDAHIDHYVYVQDAGA